MFFYLHLSVDSQHINCTIVRFIIALLGYRYVILSVVICTTHSTIRQFLFSGILTTWYVHSRSRRYPCEIVAGCARVVSCSQRREWSRRKLGRQIGRGSWWSPAGTGNRSRMFDGTFTVPGSCRVRAGHCSHNIHEKFETLLWIEQK